MIVADTARADEAYAVDPLVMPTLRSLAADGTVFTRAFASAPWTLPSHGALFTGCYSSKHGAHGEHPYLQSENITLAEAFAEAGYETWGATNNTWISGEFGFDQGFETFWRGWQLIQSDHDVGSVLHEPGPVQRLKAGVSSIASGNPVVNAINASYTQYQRSRGDYGGGRTTDRLVSWLQKRDSDRPFFGFVNYLEPHIEYAPPQAYTEPFLPTGGSYSEARAIRQDPRAFDVGEYGLDEREFRLLRALYRGELAYVDAQLDRIRTALKNAGAWEETILIVLGDHGENLGDHGFFGHQYNCYDSLLHVPLVITGGPFDNGGTSEQLVQLTDVGPSLLEAAHITATDFQNQAQGQSFHPDQRGEREYVFAEYLSPQPSIERLEARFGELPAHVYEYDRSLFVIRSTDEKLIRGTDGHVEYYQIDRDPREQTDRSASEQRRVERLSERLGTWRDGFDHAEVSGEVSITDSTKERLAQLGYM